MKIIYKIVIVSLISTLVLTFGITTSEAKNIAPKKQKAIKNSQVKIIKKINKKINYPWHNNVLATQFYIGETGIYGTTAWNCHAVADYGGIDSPFNRKGVYPNFTPKENPFYLALPYTDIGATATHKTDIPWYKAAQDKGGNYSFVKNRWIMMKRGNNVCYGQWEDSLTPDILDASGNRIGYGQPNAFSYVFGTATPTHPGIDVSPALSTCLGMYNANDKIYAHSDGIVSWKFVEESEVPTGAWKNIITTTRVNWKNCQE